MAILHLDNSDLEIRFNLSAYMAIENQWGSYAAMQEAQRNKSTNMDTFLQLLAIMADSATAYRLDCEIDEIPPEQRADPKYIKRHMDLYCLQQARVAAAQCMAESNHLQTIDEASDEPRDLVLEELEKKTTGA